jgi:hypothetical protein
MPRQLGTRDTTGVAAPAIDNSGENPFGNGFWVARFFAPQLPRVPFSIYRMAIKGPPSSQLRMYLDSRHVTGTPRASINQWGQEQIEVEPGQIVIFYWNTALTPAPSVTMWLQERE